MVYLIVTLPLRLEGEFLKLAYYDIGREVIIIYRWTIRANVVYNVREIKIKSRRLVNKEVIAVV